VLTAATKALLPIATLDFTLVQQLASKEKVDLVAVAVAEAPTEMVVQAAQTLSSMAKETVVVMVEMAL
jgi:hypothetical protein